MTQQILTITDSNATAKILPDSGFNCYSYQIVRNGQPVEHLWAHPEVGKNDAPSSHSGIPILFPFPGRIGGEVLHYEGRDYPLQAGDGQGNAIHGFVLNRPWRVLELKATRAVGQFQASIDDPSLLEHWPADFRITVTYRLREGALQCDLCVENPGERTLPCGLGTHPHFRLPLATETPADDCIITLPVSQSWELDDMLPTGKVHTTPETTQLTRGKRFAECQLDDVFTGLESQDGKCTTSIRDPGSGRTLQQTFDATFGHCVVYNPPHREAICIEPYSCVPDAFRMEADGHPAGLRRLEAGQAFRSTIEIRVD